MFITKSYVNAGAVVGMRRAQTAVPPRGKAPVTLATAFCLAGLLAATSPAWTISTIAPEPEPLAALGAILPPVISDNFDEFVKAASATCEALPSPLLFSRLRLSLQVPLTKLLEYSGSGAARRSYRVQSAPPPARSAVLYVPGWWNTPRDASSRALVHALLARHQQVLLLDTSAAFCTGYISAVANVTPLAHLLYTFIKNAHKAGYPVSSIHLIGFSLGAHVVGLTGKLVKKKLNATLGRITALDPAKPCFTRTGYRLSKQDAQFVQVIHSSAGVLGLEEPLGHADVYVNGLTGNHPECQNKSISLECDHAQAWKLFAASAINDKTFMGRRCASWSELVQNECNGDEAVLGYSCSTDSKGMFLYKSEEQRKPKQKQMQVFNIFDILTWPVTWRFNASE